MNQLVCILISSKREKGESRATTLQFTPAACRSHFRSAAYHLYLNHWRKRHRNLTEWKPPVKIFQFHYFSFRHFPLLPLPPSCCCCIAHNNNNSNNKKVSAKCKVFSSSPPMRWAAKFTSLVLSPRSAAVHGPPAPRRTFHTCSFCHFYRPRSVRAAVVHCACECGNR